MKRSRSRKYKNIFQEVKLSKEPKDAFKQCPYCDNKNLLEIDENVFCDCGWNSISVYQQAQDIYLKALMMNGIY